MRIGVTFHPRHFDSAGWWMLITHSNSHLAVKSFQVSRIRNHHNFPTQTIRTLLLEKKRTLITMLTRGLNALGVGHRK